MSRASVSPLELVIEVGVPRTWLGANVIVTSIDGWTGGGVPVRRKETPRSRQHGSFSQRGFREGRLVTVEGIAWADSRPEAGLLADELAALLAEGTKGRIRVLDAQLGERWADCYLTGTPEIDWDGEQDIEFAYDVYCPDPRRYGELFTASVGTSRQGGGLRFPLFAGTPHVEERRNLSTDPRATKALPFYSAPGGIATTSGLQGNPDGISTANRVSYTAGQSNIGVLLASGLTAGKTYTFSAWVRHDAIGAGASFGFAENGVQAGPAIAPVAGVWQRVSWTRTIGGAGGGLVGYRLASATGAGNFLITGLLVEEGSDLGPYFDGSKAPPVGYVRSWTGAEHASPSILSQTTGRRGILDFGEGGSLGTVTFTNRGTSEVSPLLKVTGPTTGFTITEVETRRRLEFAGPVGRNEVLWLDSRTGTAKINGEQDRSTGIRRDEWPEVPGRSSRTYLFESPNDPTATLTLEASPAWW